MLRGKSLATHTAELLPTITQEVDVTLEQAGSWPVYCEGGRAGAWEAAPAGLCGRVHPGLSGLVVGTTREAGSAAECASHAVKGAAAVACREAHWAAAARALGWHLTRAAACPPRGAALQCTTTTLLACGPPWWCREGARSRCQHATPSGGWAPLARLHRSPLTLASLPPPCPQLFPPFAPFSAPPALPLPAGTFLEVFKQAQPASPLSTPLPCSLPILTNTPRAETETALAAPPPWRAARLITLSSAAQLLPACTVPFFLPALPRDALLTHHLEPEAVSTGRGWVAQGPARQENLWGAPPLSAAERASPPSRRHTNLTYTLPLRTSTGYTGRSTGSVLSCNPCGMG